MEKNNGETVDSLLKTMGVFLHEIKNPVTALMFQTEALKSELPKKFQPEIEAMEKEISRLSDLAKNAGSYLQNPEGNPESVDLLKLVNDIAKTMPCEISVDADSRCSFVVAFDKDRARSVFENLIKNACESNGEKDADVAVAFQKNNGTVTVNIMDRGKGFTTEAAEKMFDFGFTTKPQGSGIGLFLAKRFVEARNGSLRLFPRDGGGTVSEVIIRVED